MKAPWEALKSSSQGHTAHRLSGNQCPQVCGKGPIFHLEYAIGQMRACHQSHGCFLTDILKKTLLYPSSTNPETLVHS